MSTNYQVIKTEEQLRQAVEHLEKHSVIGLDTETTDLDPYNSRLRLIQLATPDGVRIIDLDAFANGDPQEQRRARPAEALTRRAASDKNRAQRKVRREVY